MKKFGTPIGAGPGMATDSVGFVVVGTPCGVRSGGVVSFVAVSVSVLVLPCAGGFGSLLCVVDCCSCWPPCGCAAVGAAGVLCCVETGGLVGVLCVDVESAGGRSATATT